ncbi:MAG TPA: hypothetical protein VGE89_01220 [Bryobacteraceae bacterium]|jgi:hypothetical protein
MTQTTALVVVGVVLLAACAAIAQTARAIARARIRRQRRSSRIASVVTGLPASPEDQISTNAVSQLR